VGEKLARRILAVRQARGGFRKVEDLRRVPGIGPAMLEALRPWVCVGSEDFEDSEPPVAEPPPDRPRAAGGKPSAGREAALRGVRINVNVASGADLRRLPQIGAKRSRAILEERARRPFASVEELRRVRGIGPKILRRLRPYVTVSGPAVQVRKAE
jgi:competence protein ComEA